MPFFSIIVPVYNVEEYLDRCIQSILKQQWTDYEVVLINDGSTDASESICRKYEDGRRVKLISKENGGLSSARNAGLDNAEGQYIVFLDSDDYIEDNSLSLLAREINKNEADVYIIKARSIFEDGEQHDLHPDKPCKIYTRKEYFASLNIYSACAPYMVYDRQFLQEKNLRFYEGILHEDELWSPQVLLHAEKICYTNVFVYYHCLRRGSITQSKNYHRRGTSLKVVLEELLKIPGFVSSDDCKILRNRWACLYLEAVVFLNAERDLIMKYPRSLSFKFSNTRKMKAKSLLYMISPGLYVSVHNLIK